MAKGTFAAGCFWGIEAAFGKLDGVTATAVGYIGGSLENPSYEDICTGTTGHAEAVDVEFAGERISYGELLDVFWKIHDPTTRNRQGPDVGTQYRSAIFFHSPEQKAAARESKEKAQARFSDPIVTEITAALAFWQAEDYHQKYFEKRGISPQCDI